MDIKDITNLELEAQYTVISNLQTQLKKVEEENKSLKLMLEGTVPLISNNVMDIGISPSRIICETQIAILKNFAITRELTLEESKKFQIYVDILETLKKEKDDGVKANISEDELLKLVKNE